MGDGVDDFVIVARAKAHARRREHSYRVIDPYYDFFVMEIEADGQLRSEDLMEKNLVVLIIHGAGAEAWRSDNPGPSSSSLTCRSRKSCAAPAASQKVVNAIFAEEASSTRATRLFSGTGNSIGTSRSGPRGGLAASDSPARLQIVVLSLPITPFARQIRR